jgi:hypothetical protein
MTTEPTSRYLFEVQSDGRASIVAGCMLAAIFLYWILASLSAWHQDRKRVREKGERDDDKA